MLNAQEITGVVLAGGKSARFGSNKALSKFNGKTFLQHTVERLQPFTKEVVIAGSYPEYENADIPVLADIVEGIGPLGGIYTALEYSRTPRILVMTCDMPLISGEVITYMLEAAGDETVTGWEQSEHGGMFPLLVSKEAVSRVKEAIGKGQFSVKQLFDSEDTKLIAIPEAWRHCFVNINNQEEYDRLTT